MFERTNNWRDAKTGLKTRFHPQLETSAVSRDIDDEVIDRKLERGSSLQKARLKFYPSIDVELEPLFAGYIQAEFSEAKDMLHEMGYRNNPTAYVEVTDELGPDDGSFARQIVTESGVRFNRPFLHNQPTLFNREKRQIHICTYVVEEGTEPHELFDVNGDIVVIFAHEERSAWLQPMRHVTVNDSEARVGVRDFRDDWFDEFEEELGGKNKVRWSTSN